MDTGTVHLGGTKICSSKKCSELARREKIPRIYISCNSGARIGLNEQIKNAYKIKWKNDNIDDGMDYLYLEDSDYHEFKEFVDCEKVVQDDNILWKIRSIESEGVYVLDGSALIASETARAYEETFTLSYVTGRTVGIGSYLIKLGERVIQKHDSPIILTGYRALNNVLGKQLYASNLQIGGPDIMHHNGITHRVVKTDQEGVDEIITWLSYLRVSESPKQNPPTFIPTSSNYKMEKMIESILDYDSFFETMSNWAGSVITGRGKIDGMPIGILATNTNPSKQKVPVDPGEPNSSEYEINYSGSVWYPNSSQKTAQSIEDIKRENIPLLILANWRGFSGGTGDMFNDVLRFGSDIVRALENYTKPVYIYVPPYSQLRGGALVVLSYSINRSNIKLLADPTSSFNVLEPTGLQSIKYREKDVLATMKRHNVEINQENKSAYSKVVLDYIDLHDRPSSSSRYKIIDQELEWKDAREYFIKELNKFYDAID